MRFSFVNRYVIEPPGFLQAGEELKERIDPVCRASDLGESVHTLIIGLDCWLDPEKYPPEYRLSRSGKNRVPSSKVPGTYVECFFLCKEYTFGYYQIKDLSVREAKLLILAKLLALADHFLKMKWRIDFDARLFKELLLQVEAEVKATPEAAA